MCVIYVARYGCSVIGRYANKEAEKIHAGTPSQRLPVDIQSVPRRQLRVLGNASVLDNLRVPSADRVGASKAAARVTTASESVIHGVSACPGLRPLRANGSTVKPVVDGLFHTRSCTKIAPWPQQRHAFTAR